MNKQPYPYCKHGVYVGGCGVDYMCGACELGEETPSPRQLLRIEFDLCEAYDKAVAQIEKIQVDAGVTLEPKVVLALLADKRNAWLRARANYQRAWDLSKHFDDHKWLDREHSRLAREWNDMSGEDQFESLPSYVLDGAY